MADQEIKTSIDALVAYLNEHGESGVNGVSAALGVSEQVVLEWANILEKAGVIRILHKSGRLFLAPMRGQQATNIAVRDIKQAEESRLQTEMDAEVAMVGQIETRIDEFSKSTAKIDTLLKTKYKDVKELLDKINAVEAHIERIEKAMNARAAHINDVANQAQKDFDIVEKYKSNLSLFSTDTNNAKAVAQELNDLLKSYQNNITAMSKNLETVVYQYRKNALDIGRNIREKHDELRQVISFEEKQISEYERVSTDYKRNTEALIRRTEQTSKHIRDEMAKERQQIEQLTAASVPQMTKLKGQIGSMKNDLGDLAQLNANIVAVKNSLADVSKQKDDILNQLRKMQQELKNIKTSTKGSTDKSIESIKDRHATVSESITSLRGKVDDISKSFDQLREGK